MPTLEEIGNRLREIRGERTAAEIARLLGVTTSAIYFYEHGKREPKRETKQRYAELAGVPVADIFY